jgi:pimeloyl-ACP methyl ester carboxylesterase
MKKFMTYAFSLILLLIMAGGVVYAFFPQLMLDITYKQYSSAAKLEAKATDFDGYKVHYFASKTPDKAETMVLVHGMGDDKNSFLQSAAKLSEHYNLILPDLLGHGENERDPNRNYSIDSQSDFLKALLGKLGLERVHLVGNSMGGHTVAVFAIKFPESVSTLVLLDAAGIKVDDHVVYTGFGKTIDSDEAMRAVMDRVFYKAPAIPGSVRNLMREQINASKDFVDNTLVKDITGGAYFNLKDRVQLIQAPTLVLQGKHDQVVKMNSAEYYAANIPMARLQILENAGHSPQLEIANEVSQAIIEFIQKGKANMIKSTKNNHAALTQYYRWYQLYEGELSEVRINNQMNILSDDVLIKSAAGEMKGSANYPARLAVYKGWKNAHHVQNVNVSELEDGKLNLEADIIYQNIQPSGEESIYSLHYSTFLEKSEGELLPLFTELNLVPTGKLEPKPFEAAYAENRVMSLLHYWLLNMEQLDGNVTPFEELLAPGFALDFSTAGMIESTEKLATWLLTVPTRLKLSSHYPQNFTVKAVGDNQYEMEVDLVWRGVTKDDQAVKATTHHKWLVDDDPNERFARIKTAKITQVDALAPVQ